MLQCIMIRENTSFVLTGNNGDTHLFERNKK